MGGQNGPQGVGSVGEQCDGVMALVPQYVQNGDTAGAEIDRQDYQAAIFKVLVGAKDATTFTSLTYKVQHCATSGGSFADASVGHFGAVSGSVLTISTAGADLVVDLRGMYRYIKLLFTGVISGGNAQAFGAATCMLSGKGYQTT